MRRLIPIIAFALASANCSRELPWSASTDRSTGTSNPDPSTPNSNRTGPSQVPTSPGLSPVAGSPTNTDNSLTVLSVGTLGAGISGQSRGTAFEILSTRAVHVVATVRGPAGSYPVFTDFYVKGVRFSRQKATLVIDGSSLGQLRSTLNVAGTSIQNYNLSGDWESRISVEGISGPIAVASFSLN